MPVSRTRARQPVADVADFPVRYRDLTQAGFDRLVPGDGINVKVWERGGLGVFAADPSGVSDLGVQELDRNGNVSFPILGKFQAGGMTLAQLRRAIVARLSRLVAGADVSVTRAADARGQMVTVQGNLTKPGMYPITQTAQRLSSAWRRRRRCRPTPNNLSSACAATTRWPRCGCRTFTATRTTTSCCARATSSPPMNRASS